MKRFRCTVSLTLNFQESTTDEAEAQEIIQETLQKLYPTNVEFEEMYEVDSDEGEQEEENYVEYVDDNYLGDN